MYGTLLMRIISKAMKAASAMDRAMPSRPASSTKDGIKRISASAWNPFRTVYTCACVGCYMTSRIYARQRTNDARQKKRAPSPSQHDHERKAHRECGDPKRENLPTGSIIHYVLYKPCHCLEVIEIHKDATSKACSTVHSPRHTPTLTYQLMHHDRGKEQERTHTDNRDDAQGNRTRVCELITP